MYGLDNAMQAIQSYLAVVKVGAICAIIAMVLAIINGIMLMVVLYKQENHRRRIESATHKIDVNSVYGGKLERSINSGN